MSDRMPEKVMEDPDEEEVYNFDIAYGIDACNYDTVSQFHAVWQYRCLLGICRSRPCGSK